VKVIRKSTSINDAVALGLDTNLSQILTFDAKKDRGARSYARESLRKLGSS